MPLVKLADVPDHARVDDTKRTGLNSATCAHCGLPALGDQVRVTFSWDNTWGDVYTHPADECFQPIVKARPVFKPASTA